MLKNWLQMINKMTELHKSYITKKRKGTYLILDLYLGDTHASHLLGIYPDWDKECMYLSDLRTNPDYRYQGYASQLIQRAIWEARRNGCKIIKLDDCSDGYGTDHNIYINNGFRYGMEPEMYLML